MSQKPDSTTAKDSGTSFAAHPEGQYAMVCVDVVNLGTNIEQFPGQDAKEVDKAALVFASGERQEDKTLTVVTVEMTLSMNEKANMRKFLESWRGKSYTPEQAASGVPLHKVQGQTALVSVEHILTKRGRKFAKVRSIAPLPKKMDAPDAGVLEEYERPKFLEDKKAEYAKALAKYRQDVHADVDQSVGEYPDDFDQTDDTDDLPF
jgi:hypothetical protein